MLLRFQKYKVSFENDVDPDQLASDENRRPGSIPVSITIKNLIGPHREKTLTLLHANNKNDVKSALIGKYSNICVKRPLSKRPNIGFQDQISLNAGQHFWRMLQGDYSAILSNFIKLPIVIKIFILSIFEWPF